ncbi:MAG: MFS transporter [Candidatus Edwardsbacteria bacterium]|nr:MFS transporter [Candidatus Edwardsbacteria bacterium]MBU1576468.1 MFS transporter [Candidatus Edwardsbacteria bacterium]MBU2464473.1 MFS transporter [Candidatus Edwardsbacteria bacterium]MBU2594541.1 MFS transporter [Candidatus Edwardsbacteria bacterium]
MTIVGFLVNYFKLAGRFSRNAKLYLLSTFLISVGFSFYGVLFNLYLTEGGLQEGIIGSILSLSGLALVITALPAGILSDRLGRKKAMIIGTLAGALLSIFRALTVNGPGLLSLSFLGGIASTLYVLSAAPFMMENSRPEERTHLFSASFAVMLMAGIAGNLAAGELPGLVMNIFGISIFTAYRFALLLGSGIFLTALWPLFKISETPKVPDESNLISLKRLVQGFKAAAGFVWCNLWIGLGAGLVIPFFNLYFAKRFGASSSQIGLYFSVSQIFTLAAVLVGPALAKRFGKVKTVVAMELLSLPFLISLGAEKVLYIAVLSFWMRASLMQMSSPISSAFMMEVVPDGARATVNSIATMAWTLSWTFSTAFSGWAMQHYGYAMPYYLTAGCYAVSAISFYLLYNRKERRR